MNVEARRGILAAGNFIVDRIKRIDAYPEECMLANIESEDRSNGGGPYNVLRDLAAMNVDYPLIAAGHVGADADGDWITADCEAREIDTAYLRRDVRSPTSYTEVMTAGDSGRRTFFHHRGANVSFNGCGIDFEMCPARSFHLAYLMLLDGLDTFGSAGRTRAADLLKRASASGLVTSIDIVSAENPNFRDIVLSAAPHVDHLLINEIEASRVLDRKVTPDEPDELLHVAKAILAAGVRQSVVIHTEHGVVTASRNGDTHAQGSVQLPASYVQGANGAGDAFAAGYLHGIHENLSIEETLEIAVSVAAVCLADASPSAAIIPLDECVRLGQSHGFRSFTI
jgi:sugar/nucleoside kinase (ribokinase family)